MTNKHELHRIQYFLIKQLEELVQEFKESSGNDDFAEGRIYQLENTILRLQNSDYTSPDSEIDKLIYHCTGYPILYQ